jgi:hypothetical protein
MSNSVHAQSSVAQLVVNRLNFERFKNNIRILASFGDRLQMTTAGSQSYTDAANWVEDQLEAAGYTIEYQNFTFQGVPRQTIYVTKVGTVRPDQMYIISGHLDGRGGGGAADDDGSGSSLVLESALALAQPDIKTDISIRLIFWNNEESGLNGSTAYVTERNTQQGIENPPGSGIYPEPTWLGIVQHDMILFDHGLPPQPNQIPNADIDIEYQASSIFASQSQALANTLFAGNGTYSTDYPAEVGSNMQKTDSWPFRDYTAAVSVRENQRIAEIGNGSNPHWHKATDLYATFSEADFRLGFNCVQMTLGKVAELAGVWQDLTSNPPTAGEDAYTLGEDSGTTSLDVLANDTSAPDAGETLTIVSTTPTSQGGTINIVGGTTIDYTPAPNFNGTESFTYTINDGTPGSTSTAYVTITVNPTNDPPVAVNDAYTVQENSGATNLNVLANDNTGPDAGETLSVIAVTQGSQGGAVAIAAGGTSVDYTPAPDFSGTETFTYTINDGTPGSDATATVTMTVNPDSPPFTILQANFDASAEGFTYLDNTFRGTTQSSYASGTWISSGSYSGGGLRVNLGGINNNTINNMSGGWRISFTLSTSTNVTFFFRYNLTQTPHYESNEYSQALVSVNGVLYGTSPNDYVAQIAGNGNGGPSITTGWQQFQFTINAMSAGTHTLTIGGYNNKKTYNDESTTVLVDEVLVTGVAAGAGKVSSTDGANEDMEVANDLQRPGQSRIPEDYALEQNYPNPFNPETLIRFQLPEAGQVVVRVLNPLGQEVKSLANGPYEAGYHHVMWDGRNNNGAPVASGVYLYQLQTARFSQVKKMILLR